MGFGWGLRIARFSSRAGKPNARPCAVPDKVTSVLVWLWRLAALAGVLTRVNERDV